MPYDKTEDNEAGGGDLAVAGPGGGTRIVLDDVRRMAGVDIPNNWEQTAPHRVAKAARYKLDGTSWWRSRSSC